MAADLVMFDVRGLCFAGSAAHEPGGALLLYARANVALTIVNGRVVLRDWQLATPDVVPLVDRHNRLARQLVGQFMRRGARAARIAPSP